MSTNRFVALLRGINVGGKNPIKMDALRGCLEDVGFTNVRTYIASGNVLFESDKSLKYIEVTIDTVLERTFGYKGPTVVISQKDYEQVMAEAPIGFGSKPDIYYSDVIFLKLPVEAEKVLQDVLALKIREGVDTAHAGSKALYFTRVSTERTKSRMGKIIELTSYKSMTIRNWNTATKLLELLHSK